MDDSEVLSSDFPGVRSSATSMTSTASITSTASFYQKNTHPDGLIIPGTKMAIAGPLLVHFCRMDHQKSFFLLILAPFLKTDS